MSSVTQKETPSPTQLDTAIKIQMSPLSDLSAVTEESEKTNL
jgi:hypothetical protein